MKPAVNKMLGLGALNWSQQAPESKGASNKVTVQNRGWKYGVLVKGNIARDFERLEAEFP